MAHAVSKECADGGQNVWWLGACTYNILIIILIDFSLTEKAATLIFIFGRGSAVSSAKQGKSGSLYNLVKNK